MPSKLRRRVANSPIARGVAVPLRTMMVARYDAQVIGRSVDWLVHGRETTNFTYDLNPLNLDQLCWFVSAVSGAQIGQARSWIQEVQDNKKLNEQLIRRLSSNPRRGSARKSRIGHAGSGGTRSSGPHSPIMSSRPALSSDSGPVPSPLPCSRTDMAG